MKFVVSKKLIDNRTLYLSVLWMVIFLLGALVLNGIAKGIDFGMTPVMWINTILGNEAEFIEPLLLSDLLLSLHTDLFGLILIFILMTALLIRTSRAKGFKITVLLLGVITLLFYGIGLITSLWIGRVGVIFSWGGFYLFHLLMIGIALDIFILLIRKKF
ncbi:MAG: hypothetical protein NT103_06950 [Campylobacterales bacterium]|nr:hypothetical protein [Campylobacterales bacterium]